MLARLAGLAWLARFALPIPHAPALSVVWQTAGQFNTRHCSSRARTTCEPWVRVHAGQCRWPALGIYSVWSPVQQSGVPTGRDGILTDCRGGLTLRRFISCHLPAPQSNLGYHSLYMAPDRIDTVAHVNVRSDRFRSEPVRCASVYSMTSMDLPVVVTMGRQRSSECRIGWPKSSSELGWKHVRLCKDAGQAFTSVSFG